MTPDRIDLRLVTPAVREVTPFECTVREHCEIILRSPHFDASERSRKFLQFVVDETLGGRGNHLNQASIATAVFGRDANFDAVMDPIVRVQAGRLRRSLERYYLLAASGPNSLRIELPKGSYAPSFVENEGVSRANQVSASGIEKSWPSVLVQPFETFSDHDAEASALLEDELTMELSRYGTLGVVRRRDIEHMDVTQLPALRFALSGTLRHSGQDATVRIRLIDRTTGTQLWCDEYRAHEAPGQTADGIEDIGRVIAARVGDEHGILLRQLVHERTPENPDATSVIDAILRSHHFFSSGQVGDLVPTLHALRHFTSHDPDNALAWIHLARLCQANYMFEMTGLSTPIEATIGYAYQGVLLDPRSARASCVLAAALLIKGELQSARGEIERALAHNVESLAYRENLGWLLALAGEWDRGMALVHGAARRNPYCLPHIKQALWADHLICGEFENAYVAALEYRDSSGFWPKLMMACCLGHLGRANEARAPVMDLLEAKPDFARSGRRLVGYLIKSPDFSGRIFEGLARAGCVVS
jgi:adenylate cyclase